MTNLADKLSRISRTDWRHHTFPNTESFCTCKACNVYLQNLKFSIWKGQNV